MNAGRLYLGTGDEGLKGKVFITAGLGGMSGAQAKAAVIAGSVCVVAEINEEAATKRHCAGLGRRVEYDLPVVIDRMEIARSRGEAVSIAYVGNIVDLLEYLVERKVRVDLGSDQTSLHIPFSGGYYPVGLSLEESNQLMADDKPAFKETVYASLRRHVNAVNTLVERGMHFWDYGNAFLLESSRAGADIMAENGVDFRYQSYVQDIMGPMCFDYGFGPFRWVCTSADPKDLSISDQIAGRRSSIGRPGADGNTPTISRQSTLDRTGGRKTP